MASTSRDDSSGSPQLNDGLASADPFRRAKATLRLGRHADPQALDQLLALLSDPEWRVVKAALQSLRRYRDPRIVPAVQAVVARNDSFFGFTRGGAIGFASMRALRSQGKAGFQALLTMLREFQEDEVWGQAVERQLAVLRDPRAIEPLIAAFASPIYEVASTAAAKMRRFGADAIPPLIAALSITDQSVYEKVSWALRWIGAPAVPALLDALRHAADENIRSGAADVLGNTDIDSEEVREALHAALDDEDVDVRRMAMWSLGNLGDPRVLDQLLVEQPSPGPGSLRPASTLAQIGAAAVPRLIAALEDRSRPEYQRMNAARALGFIRDERAVEPLIAALRDDDEDVRVAATFALGVLKNAKSLEPLLAALAVEPLLAALQDSSSEVRTRAADALACIDDDRAFDAVAHVVRESEDDKSASHLLLTLALHHGERALPLVREIALGENRHLSIKAAAALGHLGAAAVPTLLELARDPRLERRYTGITWLKLVYHRSPDPRIVDFLFEVIQENQTSARGVAGVRYHAALALAECGDPRAVEPLLELLQDGPSMSYSVVQSLGELGDERALAALAAVYEASKAGEDTVKLDERPRRRHEAEEYQDVLLSAMAKIRARLGTT
jgi:HEAT repeat protein